LRRIHTVHCIEHLVLDMLRHLQKGMLGMVLDLGILLQDTVHEGKEGIGQSCMAWSMY
jgi:hypothetical protein